MQTFEFTNVHCALPVMLRYMRHVGYPRDSRNGRVLQINSPVATVYARPEQRVESHEWRDSNPFFHFYESLWMLAGRQEVAPLTKYVSRMSTFSDDGEVFNAAYGYRWRHAQGDDQLQAITTRLIRDKNDRRSVLQIWDSVLDLFGADDDGLYGGRDAACNLTATFQINAVTEALDLVVFCRSNDLVWGAYGANAVHFSVLLEYMARRIGVPIGKYTQISVNLHAYDKTAGPLYEFGSAEYMADPYEIGTGGSPDDVLYPYPLFGRGEHDQWDKDCQRFVTDDGRLGVDHFAESFETQFFREVAHPIALAHDCFSTQGIDHASRMIGALEAIEACQASDWRHACRQWLLRRRREWEQKELIK